MNGKTMKLLVEYIADQHRKERERYAQTYRTIYQKPSDTKEVNQTKDNK